MNTHRLQINPLNEQETILKLQQRVQQLEDILHRIAHDLTTVGIAPPIPLQTGIAPSLADELPTRMRQVLQYLVSGYRVSAIARRLSLSPATVRNHLKLAYRRFGVHSQSELIERLRAVSSSEAA